MSKSKKKKKRKNIKISPPKKFDLNEKFKLKAYGQEVEINLADVLGEVRPMKDEISAALYEYAGAEINTDDLIEKLNDINAGTFKKIMELFENMSEG